MYPKFYLTRNFYSPKTNIIKHEMLDGGIEYYFYGGNKNPDHVTVTFFSGKRQKPDIHCTYRSLTQAEDAVQKWLDQLQHIQEWKDERKEATRKARDNKTVKVGDVFVASWGYDQTNVDAYEVVALKGTASVVVKEISTKGIKGTAGFMCESVVAVPESFVKNAKELTRRVSANGDNISIKIDECRTAHYDKNLRPHHCSWGA